MSLLSMAIEQAEVSEPAVRAAALMHIARVVARSNQAGAEQLLERGISLAQELDGGTESLLLRNGIYCAAAVSAKHALPLYAKHREINPFGTAVIGLVNTMAEHGHVDDAIAYLSDPLPGDRFPLHFLGNLERECHDDETRLRLLRAAVRAWDSRVPGGERSHAESAFAGLFGRYWRLLPLEEARATLGSVFLWARDVSSEDRRFPLTEHAELVSEREVFLFQLMPALQALEPELARGVLESYPQLAAAARRFPEGMASVSKGGWKFDRARDDSMTVGRDRVIPMSEALATDFDAPFREAHNLYAKDSNSENPNGAPKECWPSAWEFRNIAFKAGQHLGFAAEKYLARIPDADFRLFAQIELCAGAEDLPQIGGAMTWQPSRRPTARRTCSPAELDELFGPALRGVCCPQCKWTPRARSLWFCKCGYRWNTFDTRGLCPGCNHQWEVTACLQCGAMSPHAEWYAKA
jgi:hypothetical protein